MTKKQLLSMVCALSMAGALASPAFAQPTNDGVSETGPGNATQVDVGVEDSFQQNTEFDTDVDDSFNKTTEFDTDLEIEDSFQANTEYDTDIDDSFNKSAEFDTDLEIEDSFQANTEYDTDVTLTDSFNRSTEVDIDKTEYETDVEVELKAENGGMLLAGKGSQERTEIEDSYNDNRSWSTMNHTMDSYNTTSVEDNSVELNATLAQVAAGPIAAAPVTNRGTFDNDVELCTSFNEWSGINNNAQTAGSYNNAGNLNAIAVGSGSVGR